jgi:FMN reductase
MTGAVSETIAETIEQALAHARLDVPLRAVAISGSPRSPSKSMTLSEHFLAAAQKLGCETRLIDVAVLPAGALVVREHSPEVEQAIAAVAQSQIVAASSPTYRALYTGVMKCFFDLMPQSHLAGKVCVGLQTGTAPEHALSPDYGMRALFASLEGLPALSLYATDAEFTGGSPGDALVERVGALAEQAVGLARGLFPG